ncbi:hypothetical protein JMJ55_12395 [Belnapia sp. T6]|uniref:Uncharacterized protein n=1 Tax=Belnapia mucosa TaxID=2804532 RepID=A0ABS1V4F0_9PROT|nr:hypothetical protein [Belnapia mucosa]MBL6456127.1 hypothetical protein [Belnapia mucosa]
MIFRPFTMVCLVAFLGAGMHVYQTKHEAALLDRELRGIARKVEEAEARTQTLQAEWAWLNEPERLRSVAQRHLPELEAMQPAQFVRATEAERRLPSVAAYSGPTALFAVREPASLGTTTLSLLPRIADAVQVVVAEPPPAPVPAAPLAAPVLAAAEPVVAAVAPEPFLILPPPPPPPPPVPVLAAIPAPPVRIALPARPAEPRPVEPRVVTEAPPRPALVDLARATQPRPPAPKPAPRPATELASLPPVAAPRPAVQQVASTASLARPATPPAAVPHAVVAPAAAAPVAPPSPYAGSVLGGGSRPLLPPPVPFGSAGAASLRNGTLAQ